MAGNGEQDKRLSSVRPEHVEGRSWFDKPVLSGVEGLTTNGM
jgi:hypothetical protein